MVKNIYAERKKMEIGLFIIDLNMPFLDGLDTASILN